MIPVAIVARQARRLQGKHRPDGPFTHGRQQSAEPGARLLARTARPQVVVNDDHPDKPELPRPIGERVLPLLAFAVIWLSSNPRRSRSAATAMRGRTSSVSC